MKEELPRIEYVEARRVLLDAFDALRDHRDALVLVGAQAVYIQTEGRLKGYQAFTTDADLVVDPAKLGPEPPVGAAMEKAGFIFSSEPGVWAARFRRPGFEDPVVIPVDLIVPMRLAPKAGRRSARLPGNHGKATARKSEGLEGAVVDNSPIAISALDPDDPRCITVKVGGYGALFVAKLHKLGERLDTPERLQAKDAGDIYRLFDGIENEGMAELLQTLLVDDRSAAATEKGIGYARRLFVTPESPGVRLAVEALRGVAPEASVVAAMTAYARSLLDQIDK